MANANNPAKQWVADPNTVLAGPATGSTAGSIGARALVDADVSALSLIGALTSGLALAASTAAVSSSTVINTGLGALRAVIVSLGQAASSGAAFAVASAMASTGYFSLQVFANSTAALGLSTATDVVVDWIAVGAAS